MLSTLLAWSTDTLTQLQAGLEAPLYHALTRSAGVSKCSARANRSACPDAYSKRTSSVDLQHVDRGDRGDRDKTFLSRQRDTEAPRHVQVLWPTPKLEP